MRRKKIALNIDRKPAASRDRQAKIKSRPNRSRLARECAKLDPAFEKALAEEGMAANGSDWPKY